MNSIFKNMLSQYSPTTKEGKDKATHEVMQQIAFCSTHCPQGQNDVRPFIKNPSEMDIWATDYFLQLLDKINFTNNNL